MIFEKQIVGAFRAMMFSRCDDKGTAHYFSHTDFEGLRSRPFSFTAKAGHTLNGSFYFYDGCKEDRLIVFDHGFGGGHRSYMKEIEKLCQEGYKVFAYDHTGCMTSGGESANGLSQSLGDLDCAITALKALPELSGVDLSVIGHSWGGFSTMNIPALHSDISHIVGISGFVSPELLIASYFGGIMKGYRKPVMRLEEEANPEYCRFDATRTLAQTSAKALLIYSENDMMCKKKPHYDALESALSHKEGVKLLLVKNKGHNPNYTEDAVKYLGEYLEKKRKFEKQGKLVTDEQRAAFVSSFDWHRMTEQDESIWEEIFAFLRS